MLLDKANKSEQFITIQKSIEKAIQKNSYEWLTLRVESNGNIKEE